jgi:hypothetical protein
MRRNSESNRCEGKEDRDRRSNRTAYCYTAHVHRRFACISHSALYRQASNSLRCRAVYGSSQEQFPFGVELTDAWKFHHADEVAVLVGPLKSVHFYNFFGSSRTKPSNRFVGILEVMQMLRRATVIRSRSQKMIVIRRNLLL